MKKLYLKIIAFLSLFCLLQAIDCSFKGSLKQSVPYISSSLTGAILYCTGSYLLDNVEMGLKVPNYLKNELFIGVSLIGFGVTGLYYTIDKKSDKQLILPGLNLESVSLRLLNNAQKPQGSSE